MTGGRTWRFHTGQVATLRQRAQANLSGTVILSVQTRSSSSSSSRPDWTSSATLPALIGAPPRPIAHVQKLCCGRRRMPSRRWLNSDSPQIMLAMGLLRWQRGSRGGPFTAAAVFALCLASVSSLGQNLDTEFTFLLPAGRSECFFQTALKNGTMEVEYQVTASRTRRWHTSPRSVHTSALFVRN